MNAAAALLFLLVPAQAKKDKVDPVLVDRAIDKGVAYLKSQIGKYGQINRRRSEELLLYTFLHAGLTEEDPVVADLLKLVTETPLEWTYNVSLQAMILEHVHRVKWQARIAECAQFLVDNQAPAGSWGYGEPTPARPEVPSGGRKDVASSGGSSKKSAQKNPYFPKPKVVRRIPVKKTRDGKAPGDNSNSQYAALGLRACHDAGIVLPMDVIQPAEKWWRDCLGEDGWGYMNKNNAGYGSMTAGAVGSLLIYDYIQNRPWMKDPEALKGLEWLAKNWTVTENPKIAGDEGQGGWLFYYLYAVERAAIFYGTERIGAHDWYKEGATHLLEVQKPNGSWQKATDHAIWDTCFAILFLKRATRPLIDVASTDRK